MIAATQMTQFEMLLELSNIASISWLLKQNVHPAPNANIHRREMPISLHRCKTMQVSNTTFWVAEIEILETGEKKYHIM